MTIEERARAAGEIIIGLAMMLAMLVVVFPLLTIWALVERARMQKSQDEFEEDGRPVLRAIEREREEHRRAAYFRRGR